MKLQLPIKENGNLDLKELNKQILENNGWPPWTEGDGNWVVTYLPRSAEGACDAVFESYEEAYAFALGLI